MSKSTFAQRLIDIMKIRNKRQADVTNDTGIPKSALSQYCSGKFEAKQDRIYILANYFNVSEAWLMGCDVPMEKGVVHPTVAPKNELTNREQQLIDKYRQLTLEDKNRVDERIDTMLESYPENKENVS